MSVNDKLLLRNKILGVLIRDARQVSAKSPEECAHYVGITPDDYAAVEDGDRAISLPELEALSVLFNIPVDHFMGDRLLEAKSIHDLAIKEILTLRHRIVGVLLRQARLAAGKSQADCAMVLGIPESQLAAYEFGQIAVPLAELETLAEYLKIPLQDFMDGKQSPIGKKISKARARVAFDRLPSDLQSFMMESLNTDYIKTAQRLSQMPVEQLRSIAETLLEITY